MFLIKWRSDRLADLLINGSDNYSFHKTCVDDRSVSERLFDGEWHKIHLSVTPESVTLFLDCEPLETQTVPLQGKIDTSGTIAMAKSADNR